LLAPRILRMIRFGMDRLDAEERALELSTAWQLIAYRENMLKDYQLMKTRTAEALHKSRGLLARNQAATFYAYSRREMTEDDWRS
jgi:hypothetical protein